MVWRRPGVQGSRKVSGGKARCRVQARFGRFRAGRKVKAGSGGGFRVGSSARVRCGLADLRKGRKRAPHAVGDIT